MIELNNKDIELLNRVQNNFPVCHDPFKIISHELQRDKSEMILRLQQLSEEGFISRLGGVLNHKKNGSSTLAALSVPENEIDDTANLVNSFIEVNHNYLREHEFNMWFVVTAATQEKLQQVLEQIKTETGMPLINLPMLKSFHINLAFPL